jgi:hypothetical protein
MSNIDWSKAPERFPLWLEGTNDEHRKHSGWYRDAGLVFEGADGGQWRASREGQFFTVHRKPEPATWNGKGLPPVGTKLEAGFACEEFSDWHKGVCVASGEDPEGREEFCVVQFGNKIAMYTVEGRRMRPIRTAEQIAADERKAQILEMIDVFGLDTSIWGLDTVREICGHLWEAGYRKQVTR